MPTTGTIPLQEVIAGQLITAALWNNEFGNISDLMDPPGLGGYSDSDSEMQIQTNPYPGSVTSHATSTAGELERIRYQLAQILGTDYWYKPAATDLTSVGDVVVPLGSVIDYPKSAVPNSNWHLADGTAISRATYADLFSLIGTTFGAGDASTTFNLPNYTDKISISAGNLYALADTGGAVSQTLTDPGHTHTHNSHTHTDAGHTHSTPAHQHLLNSDAAAVIPSSSVHTGSLYSTDSDGATLFPTISGASNSTLRANFKNQTTSGGSGTSGSGTASISSTVATEQSQVTGITPLVVPTLPPYIGMYKMIRIL